MITCPVCHSQVADDNSFCTVCGNPLPANTPVAPPQQAGFNYYQPVAPVDPSDHTAEFSQSDVQANKPYALLLYISSVLGIFIALLGGKDSPYVQFHLRQNLKFLVTEILLGLCMSVLFFTILVPIVAGVALAVVEVIRIICFFQVCGNKSKEPAIIKNLGFLK